MSDLKTIHDIDVDYSKSQLYRRLDKLEENGLVEPQRGGRNQYLLNQDDLKVLHRLADLENGSRSVETAIVQLENELLREEVNELRDKTKTLENELVVRNNTIQRLRGQWFDKIRKRFQSVVNWFK